MESVSQEKLSDIKQAAVERMAVNFPNHIPEIIKAFDEVIKESVKLSVEQIFLGSSVQELQMAINILKRKLEAPAPAPAPVPAPAPAPAPAPVIHKVINTNVDKGSKNSKKNNRSADLLE